jgi:hypothetical protein
MTCWHLGTWTCREAPGYPNMGPYYITTCDRCNTMVCFSKGRFQYRFLFWRRVKQA